jgi:hypothetical protein
MMDGVVSMGMNAGFRESWEFFDLIHNSHLYKKASNLSSLVIKFVCIMHSALMSRLVSISLHRYVYTF